MTILKNKVAMRFFGPFNLQICNKKFITLFPHMYGLERESNSEVQLLF